MELLQFMEPWMIPIAIMAFVTLIVLITTIGSIVKANMEKNETKDLTQNKEFLDALKEFKESMDHRVKRLEKMMAESKSVQDSEKIRPELSSTEKSIEIEMNDQDRKEKAKESGDSTKLRNMLS